MENTMEQTVSALQVFTAVLVLLVLVVAFIIGLWLRALVKQSALHPSVALRLIETIAVVIGGAIGSVVVLVLLVILWPAAGNWVINTFLSDTIIWQTEFQQWVTRNINDPTTSSAIGLLIQRIQFGSAFLGFLAGWGAKWLIGTVMGKSFHTGTNYSATAAVARKR
jgi:hypothetical protein